MMDYDDACRLVAKMRDEGFDYCFDGYSSWNDIHDEEFHRLRKSYLDASNNLKSYIIAMHKHLSNGED